MIGSTCGSKLKFQVQMLMEENMQQQAEFVKKNNEKKKLLKRSNNSLTACRARTGSSRVVSDAQELT